MNLLMQRFYFNGEPLPNFYSIISGKLDNLIVHGIRGAVCYLLLHELAHFQLNHFNLGSGKIRSAFGDLIVEQELSKFQLQEFEADVYTFNCLKDEYRGVNYSWASCALNPFLNLDMFNDESITHPLTVNRLDYINKIFDDSFVYTPDEWNKHISNQAISYKNIKNYSKEIDSFGANPFFKEFGRDDISEGIFKLNTFLSSTEFDLSKIFETSLDWKSLKNLLQQ